MCPEPQEKLKLPVKLKKVKENKNTTKEIVKLYVRQYELIFLVNESR